MSLAQGFQWLGDTSLGVFLKGSTVAFAATESLHILALALLGGAVLVTDLAALGVALRRVPPGDVARGLQPLFWTGLAAMALSGIALVSAGPFKYYTNPLFPWKLGVLVVAILVQVGLQWKLTRLTKLDGLTKSIAGASILLWLSVTILGRWLGLI